MRDAEWLAGTVNRASGREVDARVRDNLIAIIRDPEVGAYTFGVTAGGRL